MIYSKFFKRLLDFTLSLIALIILSPVYAVLALLVRIKLGSPIIFSQRRLGKGGKVFKIHKFRTMTNATDEDGNLLSDEERLTSFGRLLRSTSLDELPEIFDIFTGKLSIVGPRPLIEEYLPYFTEEESARHKVRGGLIPPEVLYKNIQPTWDEQLKYEADYANKVTFVTDLKILLATAGGLFSRNSVDYGSYVRPALSVERAKEKEKETTGVR
ncbi:MAG: sugar transferase [Clostridia bacterium]|nr:sugar transferase [Clostridia bacterium]